MKKFLLLLCTMLVSLTGSAKVVKDVLTAADFPATGTGYTDFTGVQKTSAAVYAGQSAKNDAGAIQLRSKYSNSGIVSTVSGGKVKSVTITVASGSNTIDVYGSNTAYTAATDLYATTGNTNQGTKVGSVSATGTVTFTEDYKYVGIRSNSGAIYVTSVEIEWEEAEGTVNAPIFAPNNTDFVGSQEVSLSCTTEGASIFYHIGSEVTSQNAQAYTGPFTINETSTIYAVARKDDKTSNQVSKTYTRLPEFASLADLASSLPAEKTAAKVNVTIENAPVDSFYVTSQGKINGVYTHVGTTVIELYCYDVPTDWEVGGTLSGTLTGEWLLYNGVSELQKWEGGWEALTYSATPAAEPNTDILYFTAEQLRDEVANVGQALVGILGVTTTGDKYITGGTQTERASADGTLASVRAPQEAEYIEVLPATDGYYLRQHTAEAGQGYLACSAGGNFSIAAESGASVWTIVGPSEDGYGSISSYDDLYTDIEKALNDNMVRFISSGQYMNGQAFGGTGGLRGGTGAWSFNYVRNANYAVVEPEPIVFTDQLTVTVNDQSGTLEASVNIIKHDDGTIDFSLPNFILASGEDVKPVGNININGLSLVAGENYDTFSYDGPLTISVGDLEGVDMWMGPMLGELPLKLQGKVNFEDHKLFVNIDIDLSASLSQIINVKFGTDFEKPVVRVVVQEEVDVPALDYDYTLGTAGAEGTYDTSMVEDATSCTASNALVFGFNPTTGEYVADAMTTYDGWHAANGDLAAQGEAPFCIKMWNNGTFWYCIDPEKADTDATYKTSWLLVNPENGDAVQYNFTLNIKPAPFVGPAKNQLFTASTPQRGGWMNVDGQLKGTLQGGASVATDATDANQLFALVDYEGQTYLWNEGAQHFLNSAGQFVSILTATPIYCTEEAGYDGVCEKTYFFHFAEDKNINLGGSKQIIIDDWAEADAGNMMVINAVEGFNADAVAAVITADTSMAITSITWTITDGEGNEIATETQENCEEGKEYTVQFTLYGVELQGETTVTAGKEDQTVTLVAAFTGTLPIEYAASFDEVEHWYALRLHSNQQHWLYNAEGALAFAGEKATSDEYAWALVGDPLRGFQLYNKALGADLALDTANPCTLSEDGLNARFYVYPTAEASHSEDGFCLKAYGESQYLNYQGGAIKRWGAADAGSTFVFEEIVDIPEGINELSTVNSQLSTIYNLQGQRIQNVGRGVSIINRKKVIK